MEGDGAVCLRCVTGCNGNFCSSFFVCSGESKKAEEVLPSSGL